MHLPHRTGHLPAGGEYLDNAAVFDTIAAIATPLGEGGIGIVRLSGPHAASLAASLFQPRRRRPQPWPSHQFMLGWIIDPHTQQPIDEVLLVSMRAPRSYTTEDVVEIHCHGGSGVLRRVLELALAAGARLARPGEFTLRAFLGGRIDLPQAEAVLEVIRARTEAGLRVAATALAGGIGQRLRAVREEVLDVLARLEANLDFGEETPELEPGEMVPGLEELAGRLGAWRDTYRQGRLLREGVRVVIAGRPNVGKSSLLNRLLGQERAIVTEIPGTTRDVISETLIIKGLPVCLVDTAGLRQARDTVEQLGIARTREQLAQADLIIYLVDASQPRDAEDTVNLATLAGRPVLVGLNKSDRPRRLENMEPGAWQGFPQVTLSARTGAGVEELVEACWQTALGGEGLETGMMVTQARHHQHLEQAAARLEAAAAVLRTMGAVELAALEVREAAQELGEILGEEIGEAVLDRIFAEFCLGK